VASINPKLVSVLLAWRPDLPLLLFGLPLPQAT